MSHWGEHAVLGMSRWGEHAAFGGVPQSSLAGWRLESAWLAACLADAGGVRRGRRCVACMSTVPGGMRRVGVCGSALVSRGVPRARSGAAHEWEKSSGVRGCAVLEGALTRGCKVV